jgi:hypothetical protein
LIKILDDIFYLVKRSISFKPEERNTEKKLLISFNYCEGWLKGPDGKGFNCAELKDFSKIFIDDTRQTIMINVRLRLKEFNVKTR